uniref:Uncharacterized protein n=1 Tax=Staphylothermus marinus TaxID=2280 RepID=A0A7C4HED4_STAMA
MFREKSILKTIGIILIFLILIEMKNSFSQVSSSVEQSVLKKPFVKIRVEQDTNATRIEDILERLSTRERIYVESEVTTEVEITDKIVNFTSKRRLIRSWSINIIGSVYGTQTMYSTLPPEDFDFKFIVSYPDLDAYLSAQFITENYVKSMLEIIRSRLGGNITGFDLNIEFNGTSFVNKIPVLIFKVNGSINALSARYGLIKSSFSGYSSIYIGLPLPLNGSITHYIEAKAIGSEYKYLSRTIYSLTEHNLDNVVMYGYYNLDDLEIIVGGYPNSNITVYIYANRSYIDVFNNGEDIGYILIKSREPVELNITGIRIKYRGFKIYGLHAKTNRTISIDTIPKINITLNSTKYYYRESSSIRDPIVLTSLIIVVIAVSSYVVFKHSRVSKKQLVRKRVK